MAERWYLGTSRAAKTARAEDGMERRQHGPIEVFRAVRAGPALVQPGQIRSQPGQARECFEYERAWLAARAVSPHFPANANA